MEKLSTGTTTEARTYLRGLLSDLSAYFTLQKDGTTGEVGTNNTSRSQVTNGREASFPEVESSNRVPSVSSGDVQLFRSQQGFLAMEAKGKEYNGRLETYPELTLLSVEEFLAINRYTQYDYDNINPALRSNDTHNMHQWGPQIRLVESGLRKLPAHEGLVYRGAKDGSWAADYQVGSVITERSFTSSSLVPKMSSGSQLQFEIQSKTGRNISSCSAMQTEAAREGEILFIPDTRFEITARFARAGSTVIQMSEV